MMPRVGPSTSIVSVMCKVLLLATESGLINATLGVTALGLHVSIRIRYVAL